MDQNAIFGVQFLLSLIVYALIAKWYVTPWLAGKPVKQTTGPELISPQDVADTLGHVLGRKVSYKDVPFKTFSKAGVAQGFQPFSAMNCCPPVSTSASCGTPPAR